MHKWCWAKFSLCMLSWAGTRQSAFDCFVTQYAGVCICVKMFYFRSILLAFVSFAEYTEDGYEKSFQVCCLSVRLSVCLFVCLLSFVCLHTYTRTHTHTHTHTQARENLHVHMCAIVRLVPRTRYNIFIVPVLERW